MNAQLVDWGALAALVGLLGLGVTILRAVLASSKDLAEVKSDVAGLAKGQAGLAKDVAGLEKDVAALAAGQAELRADMKDGQAELRADMKAGQAELRADMKAGQAGLAAGQARIEDHIIQLAGGLGEVRGELKRIAPTPRPREKVGAGSS